MSKKAERKRERERERKLKKKEFDEEFRIKTWTAIAYRIHIWQGFYYCFVTEFFKIARCTWVIKTSIESDVVLL